MGTRFYPPYILSPGGVWAPRPGANDLILDQIPGAIAAWSTRRLISSAPADIARGRDASTNEQDFTAAELAGTGFTDLAGAGDGFYVTLYDQIGSNNATQSTAASQPKGVDTGTLITDGGIPVLDFEGVDDYLIADGFTNAVNSFGESTIFSKVRIDDASSLQAIHALGSGCYRLYILSGFYTLNSSTNTNVAVVTGWHTFAINFNSSGQATDFFVDGVKLWSGLANGSLPSTQFQLCARDGGLFFNGAISDAIIFNRVLSASEVSQLHIALI